MKANGAPEKLYFTSNENGTHYYTEDIPFERKYVEYIRTDDFIEKACEFLKDHLAGYDICEDDIERSVESFKLAMKL